MKSRINHRQTQRETEKKKEGEEEEVTCKNQTHPPVVILAAN